MSAQILDGKLLAAQLKTALTQEIKRLRESVQEAPRIFSIVVGNDPASLSYAASQQKTAQGVGIQYELRNFNAESTTQDDVLNLIGELNSYDHVHGIIVNKPLPAQMNFKAIINAITPYKDIEGMNLMNFGRLLMGEEGIFPCTPSAALELLKSSGVPLKGKHAIVIGRSEIVGKPVALLLLREDMTVTVCHSKTIDLPFVVHDADVVIAALGRPGFVKGEWIRQGAIVVDVGINQVEGKLVGDVDFASAVQKASHITPVPGGVGPVTAVMLMNNAVKAFKILNRI
ncbi:MAG: bifunctional 5,10-methylenetetrahydrofolate dehydrogenase/5,10-methenyltetrahydrofolate cyclohydrolase [Candidatus Omnitrophica bacterium]|nr:bifunctional 5,10-methylenetetrahydrofolate dehydrogenase/5,10-methenyltetrahydrofolate cyclohydrolase [Candidatus Omnitrophota bacterium]MDE2009066.1 bifunctional 5,10-methylenetetrahydrofolate dehydrogenase/5,10-methenyltetrahydrofolate cyclohydrolase [Candidatus Omnitrophota bacterium]MDE2214269.1 bifunctional 5,10-methylenetetrahydrofolate dehydrogenase/5,10-methenyltetrahydrofolate cyclohydrolase [Candidatus Omnitrophota bacterium]MDE2231306.1 bifunctional 5,10-methylenetetrahydrofolate 